MSESEAEGRDGNYLNEGRRVAVHLEGRVGDSSFVELRVVFDSDSVDAIGQVGDFGLDC